MLEKIELELGQLMKSEKHEFLYQYSRAAFEDELQRFRNIEDKAAKYLSFLSIGIVAYSLMLRFFSSAFFPPEGFLQWAACGVIAFTYLALVSAWSFLYRALRFIEMPRLPLHEDFINEYEPKSLPTIHFSLMRTCSTALEYARAGNAEKSQLLIKGYREIGVAMWAISISATIIVSASFFHNQESNMSDKDDKSQPSQQETSAEPDRNTPPPEVTFVLDHKIPEIEKQQQQINETGEKNRGS